MAEHTEVIVTSDAAGLLWNACIWDSHTATSLMIYKGGGTSSPKALCFLGNDYLLCAEKSRPLLHLWALNSQEPSQVVERLVTPGCVSALAASPNNAHCVMAIGERLYIWELCSGELLSVTNRHFRAITCIKFTDDGSHFISSGQDGMVVVWPLAYLICHTTDLLKQVETGEREPRFVFADHSLPVTDLFVGHGGIEAIIASVSGDQTCKMYDLRAGSLLLTIVFDSALTSVTLSCSESDAFVGALNGCIYHFNLNLPPRTLDYHLTKEELKTKFVGHTKSVTCLSPSLDGIRLLSGSVDEKVIIWDIESKQCLKVIQHKGPVCNAFFTLCSKNVFSETFKPSVVIQNFKKSMNTSEGHCVTYFTRDRVYEKDVCTQKSSDRTELEEIIALKKINKDLYTYSVEKILCQLQN